MSDLTIALAGGAVGSFITAAVGFGRRVAGVPGEVERNDFDAAERNDDLETWVADEHRQLGVDLDDRRQKAAAAGVDLGGAIPQGTAKLKAHYLHRYRDQERQARRDIFAIRSREDWTHRAYRRLTRRPQPQLTAAGRVQPVLDQWRMSVPFNNTAIEVRDPTRHTLDNTIRALSSA